MTDMEIRGACARKHHRYRLGKNVTRPFSRSVEVKKVCACLANGKRFLSAVEKHKTDPPSDQAF